MTTTANGSTTSTEIVPVFERARIALREGASLHEVAESYLVNTGALTRVPVTTVAPFPAVPKAPVLTETAKEALADLHKVFGKVAPDSRRTLTAQEIADLARERDVVKTITDLLKGREDAIKEYLFTHADVDADENNKVVLKDQVIRGKVVTEATPRDAKGHFLLAKPQQPVRIHIEGTNQDFSIEYNGGKKGSVVFDDALLLEMYEDGRVTREEYLALTRERRVFDEAKAHEAATKDKSNRLMEIIQQVTRTSGATAPYSTLQVRKAR